MSTEEPNAQQIEYWNEVSGPKWVALTDTIDAQIAPLGRRAMDVAQLQAGDRVLDVGCGCGQTSVELAERAGASGFVRGLDISAPMLESARQRASEAGLDEGRLVFTQSDAQLESFDGDFDLIFSRFGVMFFADPVAAFSNLHSALRKGGRMTFICWQSIQQNPWMVVPAIATMKFVELPPPPQPGDPGPFAFADDSLVRSILDRAGFSEIRCESLEEKVNVGGDQDDLESIANFIMQMGPAGAALRDASEETRLAALAAVQEALAPYQSAAGVEMDAAAWIVSATKNG